MCVSLLLGGCSASTFDYTADGAYDSYASTPEENTTVTEEAYTEEMETEEAEDTGIGDIGNVKVADTDRKLTYTLDLQIETYDFDKDYNDIMTKLEMVNGYVESEDMYGSKPERVNQSGRTVYATLRVPIDSYEAFVDSISDIGTVISKTSSVDDLSDRYYDIDSRIELLEERKARLMEHLKNATKMEDIITLEDEIANVIYELESLQGEQRGMDKLTDYATVNISLNEYLKASDITGGADDGNTASNAFNMTLKGMGEFFRAFGISMAAAAPVLLLLAAIAVAVVFIVKGIKKLVSVYRKHKENK